LKGNPKKWATCGKHAEIRKRGENKRLEDLSERVEERRKWDAWQRAGEFKKKICCTRSKWRNGGEQRQRERKT